MFCSWHFETPELFLESILKMTPGRNGIWKNIQAVTNPHEADYYIIMDGYNKPLPNIAEKAIYFGEDPRTPGLYRGQERLVIGRRWLGL